MTARPCPSRASPPRYIASGHLLFMRGGTLFAAPFDIDGLEVTGEAVAVLEGVVRDSIFGLTHVAVSDNGTIAYIPGNDLALGRIGWVDRRGNGGFLDVDERVYGVFDLAPDDLRFALQVADARDFVWIWSAGSPGRALTSPASVGWPVWSPDGTALAVTSVPPGETEEEVVIHDLQGGAARRLLSVPGKGRVYPDSWPQPERIAISGWNEGVAVFDLNSPANRLWPAENADRTNRIRRFAALSPDGNLIAYVSDEGAGQFQVLVEELEGNNRVQVPTDLGTEPLWCRNCEDLFFRVGNRVLASRITREPRLTAGPPREVFEAPGFIDTRGISAKLSSDGERLYYVRRSRPPIRDRIHLIHNWFDEIRVEH
jgi:hypothetical protein